MVETDAPFMAPIRGCKRCEPCHLPLVVSTLAKVLLARTLCSPGAPCCPLPVSPVPTVPPGGLLPNAPRTPYTPHIPPPLLKPQPKRWVQVGGQRPQAIQGRVLRPGYGLMRHLASTATGTVIPA